MGFKTSDQDKAASQNQTQPSSTIIQELVFFLHRRQASPSPVSSGVRVQQHLVWSRLVLLSRLILVTILVTSQTGVYIGSAAGTGQSVGKGRSAGRSDPGDRTSSRMKKIRKEEEGIG